MFGTIEKNMKKKLLSYFNQMIENNIINIESPAN